MSGSLTDVAGVGVGHWTGAATGVTVVVAPPATVGAVEVRGGSPATRETDLLAPGRLVQHVDALVLAGGSAFGLAAADGVVRALAAEGRGFATRGGPVPIVPAAAVYDAGVASGERPGPEQGAQALADARRGARTRRGAVGAGRGCTVGKWRGGDHAVPGGLGTASAREGTAVVAALAVVNALGDVLAADGRVVAGTRASRRSAPFPDTVAGEHTTLLVVATDARLTREEALLVAQSAHTGLVRCVHPAHTRFDGDVAFVLATGAADAQLDRLRLATVDVVAGAVRSAVAGGVPRAATGRRR